MQFIALLAYISVWTQCVSAKNVTFALGQKLYTDCSYPWMDFASFTIVNATVNVTAFFAPASARPACNESILNQGCVFYQGTFCKQVTECERELAGSVTGDNRCLMIYRPSNHQLTLDYVLVDSYYQPDVRVMGTIAGIVAAGIALIVAVSPCVMWCIVTACGRRPRTYAAL